MGASLAPTMRAFCALNLDVASTRRIEELARSMRADPRTPKLRWVPPTRMHVTLKFLGEMDVGLAPALGDALAPLAHADGVTRVGFRGVGGFPTDDRARVVVLLVDDASGEIARLARAVEEVAAGFGFERESRAFTPHVTLARAERPVDLREGVGRTPIALEPATLTELVLYRSDLRGPASEYTALTRLPLR